MEAREVLAAILEGDLDDDLDRIITLARERGKTARRREALLMSKGDKVRFVDTISPKYLRDLEMVVIRNTGTTITLQLPESAKFGKGMGRYYSEKLTMESKPELLVPA